MVEQSGWDTKEKEHSIDENGYQQFAQWNTILSEQHIYICTYMYFNQIVFIQIFLKSFDAQKSSKVLSGRGNFPQIWQEQRGEKKQKEILKDNF